jgi:flagellar protein FliS
MNPRHKYKATQAFSWTRIDMLLLIYDRAVATLNEGAGLLEQNRFTEIPPVSLKAMQSLLMIADGLDLEKGDLPSHVMRLVVFALDQISTPSPGAWRSAAAVMSKLREGFQEIQEQARRDEYEGRIPALDAVS